MNIKNLKPTQSYRSFSSCSCPICKLIKLSSKSDSMGTQKESLMMELMENPLFDESTIEKLSSLSLDINMLNDQIDDVMFDADLLKVYIERGTYS